MFPAPDSETRLPLRRSTPPAFKGILLGHPLPQPMPTSEVRLRSDLVAEDEQRQACQLLDTLGNEALTLTVNMEVLHHTIYDVPGEWTKRVASIVRPSFAVLGAVADAFLDVLVAFSSPEAAPHLANDAPLGDYLRGVLAWWRATLQAFEQLAEGPRQRSSYWLLRHRLDHARSFLFPELVEQAREVLRKKGDSEALEEALDALVARAGVLGRGLREPAE